MPATEWKRKTNHTGLEIIPGFIVGGYENESLHALSDCWSQRRKQSSPMWLTTKSGDDQNQHFSRPRMTVLIILQG